MCAINEVESEEHSLIRCHEYQDIKDNLDHRPAFLNSTFVNFNERDELMFSNAETEK